jgi:hypothetical protein
MYHLHTTGFFFPTMGSLRRHRLPRRTGLAIGHVYDVIVRLGGRSRQ